MAKSRWGFTWKSDYRAPSLAWTPYRINGGSLEDDYIAWLAKARGWSEEEAGEYARSQADCGLIEGDTRPLGNTCDETWLSTRVCVRTVRTYARGEIWGMHPNFADDGHSEGWRKFNSGRYGALPSDATVPTTYRVMVDGRYRDAFLSKARAIAFAKPIAETLIREDMHKCPVAA